jgi:hypothetical protein
MHESKNWAKKKRDCKVKGKGICRKDPGVALYTCPRTSHQGKPLWSAMRYAFADIPSPPTGLTAALPRSQIQTPKKPIAFCASAKPSRRRRLLTPASQCQGVSGIGHWRRMLGRTTGQVNGAVLARLARRPRLWVGGSHDRSVAGGACAAIMSDEQMLNESVNSSVPLRTQFSIFVN